MRETLRGATSIAPRMTVVALFVACGRRARRFAQIRADAAGALLREW
jgi:hypothetical protein